MAELNADNSIEDNIAMASFYALVDQLKEGKKYLEGELEDVDWVMLCLPEIAANMAFRDNISDSDKIAWGKYLRKMFYYWFSGDANEDADANEQAFWIDWKWVTSYERAEKAYQNFTRDDPEAESNIYNENAKKSLGAILCRDGYLNPENPERSFNFIDERWKDKKSQKNNWEDHYNTLYAVKSDYIDRDPDGLTAVLASFSFRSLCAGDVKYNKETDKWEIHVEKVAVFAHDIFNFEGDAALGWWSCEEKKLLTKNDSYNSSYYFLSNQMFKDFRYVTRKGADFLVLTEPHEVENFGGMTYEYSCPQKK